MRRDSKAFRERFLRWKAGELVYDLGRIIPHYGDGVEGEDPLNEWELYYVKRGEVPPYPTSADNPITSLAFYNNVDPRLALPENFFDALLKRIEVESNKFDFRRKYQLEPNLEDSVSDAAWRKRLGLAYDSKFLPIWNGDTVRLPKQIELEIPTDTNFLKSRIESNKKLMDSSRSYANNKYIRLAQNADIEALEALRKTYKTGKPVGINERAFNSRQWVKDGFVIPTMSPLNVLLNFNIRYDKLSNRMYYSDQYDFNEFDLGVPGKSFRVRGYIDLPKRLQEGKQESRNNIFSKTIDKIKSALLLNSSNTTE